MSERVEQAILCANGRVHYGPEYLKGDNVQRVLWTADSHARAASCGGSPHVVAKRTLIVTEWEVAE